MHLIISGNETAIADDTLTLHFFHFQQKKGFSIKGSVSYFGALKA